MTVKERLHQVVDELSDDEPVSAGEEAAVAEVEADHAAGVQRVPFDDVKRNYA